MTENHDQDTNETLAPEAGATALPGADETSPDRLSSGKSRANAEAARYRRQLRDTEAERDTLRDRVESLQRTEAERIARNQGVKASALWAAGATLPDLLDDGGNIDPDKVSEAVATAVDALGLRRELRGHVPAEGRTPDPSKLGPRSGFTDAFTPHQR